MEDEEGTSQKGEEGEAGSRDALALVHFES
jgi:hypothetical protein